MVLAADRRSELMAEVRDHVDAALTEAGRSDEATVRNVLERLGPPEDIVAAEGGQPGTTLDAAPAPSGRAAGTVAGWGAVEVTAVALLCLAWPALFLPFGFFLFVAFGIIGLVLVWASRVWTTRRKLTATICVVALYALLIMLTTPVSMKCSTGGGPPEPCTPGGPSPIVNPTQ